MCIRDRSEIYHLLNALAQQGKSIIMISSELPEILRMSHRIIVMCEGRITGELSSAEATQEEIMRLATPVSYTHLRAHETVLDLVCRLLLEQKNQILPSVIPAI